MTYSRPTKPRLVCLLCGLIILEAAGFEDGTGFLDDWYQDYPATCAANANGPHIDPQRLTGVEVEAVLAMRRRWLNP